MGVIGAISGLGFPPRWLLNTFLEPDILLCLHLAILDPVHVLHPLDDLSEHRVVPIEPGCGHGGEEELRAAGVRARVRHREQPGTVVALG